MTTSTRLSRFAAVFFDSRWRPYARVAVTVGAAVAIFFAGLVLFDMPEGLAQSGFFEDLFGGHGRVIEPLRYYPDGRGWRSGRHAHSRRQHRHAHHFGRSRHARHHTQKLVHVQSEDARGAGLLAPAPVVKGRRAVCVRSCDGHVFPVASVSHRSEIVSRLATCASLCPQTEVKLFMLPEGSDDMSLATEARRGETYAALLARVKGDSRSSACGCHPVASDPIESGALLNDPTLLPGDSIVTSRGVRVFRGGGVPHRSSDFLSLAESGNLSGQKRGALAAIDRLVKTPHGRAALFALRQSERHARR
jgi:hypothetical protein